MHETDLIECRARPGRTARWLHGGWALLGAAVCAMLVLAGGGHPPPLVFVPIVLAVWAAGHAALWLAAWLAWRGTRALSQPPSRPPVILVLVVAGCGLAALVGLVQVVVTLLLREFYPFRGALWWWTLAIWALHGTCLATLLLRRPLARPFAALLIFGWAALMAWQIFDHVGHGRPIDPTEMVIAVAIVVGLSDLGTRVSRSRKMDEFLGARFAQH